MLATAKGSQVVETRRPPSLLIRPSDNKDDHGLLHEKVVSAAQTYVKSCEGSRFRRNIHEVGTSARTDIENMVRQLSVYKSFISQEAIDISELLSLYAHTIFFPKNEDIPSFFVANRREGIVHFAKGAGLFTLSELIGFAKVCGLDKYKYLLYSFIFESEYNTPELFAKFIIAAELKNEEILDLLLYCDSSILSKADILYEIAKHKGITSFEELIKFAKEIRLDAKNISTIVRFAERSGFLKAKDDKLEHLDAIGRLAMAVSLTKDSANFIEFLSQIHKMTKYIFSFDEIISILHSANFNDPFELGQIAADMELTDPLELGQFAAATGLTDPFELGQFAAAMGLTKKSALELNDFRYSVRIKDYAQIGKFALGARLNLDNGNSARFLINFAAAALASPSPYDYGRFAGAFGLNLNENGLFLVITRLKLKYEPLELGRFLLGAGLNLEQLYKFARYFLKDNAYQMGVCARGVLLDTDNMVKLAQLEFGNNPYKLGQFAKGADFLSLITSLYMFIKLLDVSEPYDLGRFFLGASLSLDQANILDFIINYLDIYAPSDLGEFALGAGLNKDAKRLKKFIRAVDLDFSETDPELWKDFLKSRESFLTKKNDGEFSPESGQYKVMDRLNRFVTVLGLPDEESVQPESAPSAS